MSAEILHVLARDVQFKDYIDGKRVRRWARVADDEVEFEFSDDTRASYLPMSVVTVVRAPDEPYDLRFRAGWNRNHDAPCKVEAGTVLADGRTVREVVLYSDGAVYLHLDDVSTVISRLKGGPIPLRKAP